MEGDIAKSLKFGTCATTLWCFLFQRNIFPSLIYIADMANEMSNFDDFNINQISSKFTPRWYFVCNFLDKKFPF